MRRLAVAATLGIAHGFADLAAGLLLGSLIVSRPLGEAGALVLVYNLLAFGCQPAAGLLVDRWRRPKEATAAGLLLLCVALMASGSPGSAVLLAGFGSALFHVGGGALAICATRNGAAGSGFFTAPGVIGLAIGGALAWTNHVVIWPVELMLLASCLAVIKLRAPVSEVTDSRTLPVDYGLVMLLLLGAIALRSAVWSGLQFALQGQVRELVLLALAAGIGKTFGGALADWIGWRRWVVWALGMATPLLALGEQHRFALLLGVALLQSATPVALAATARLLPRQPATASGLALGLAIAAGGAPACSGLAATMITPLFVVMTLTAAMLAFGYVLKSAKADVPALV